MTWHYMAKDGKRWDWLVVDKDGQYGMSYDQQREERNLWAICLITGIIDLMRPRAYSTLRTYAYRNFHRDTMRKNATEWLMDDSVWPGSFRYCCEACGLHTGALRAKVLFWLKHDPKGLKARFNNLHLWVNRPTNLPSLRGKHTQTCRNCGKDYLAGNNDRASLCPDCR